MNGASGMGTTPRGFSVRYYDCPPDDCASPRASSLDLALQYGPAIHAASASMISVNTSSEKPMGVWITPKDLGWPTSRKPVGGVYWMRWSGTLVIVESGRYNFNFDVGFNSNSQLKIDGKSVLTDGQCFNSKNEAICKSK